MTYVPTGEQAAILGYDHHRHARVLAGPGTGKSATLVRDFLADKKDWDDVHGFVIGAE